MSFLLSDALPGREALLVLDVFVGAALDQQVTDCVHVVGDGIVQRGVAVLILCVDIGAFLDQQVADVVAAELGRYRQQCVIVAVGDVACEHVALDVGLHNLDLIELDCVEHLVTLLLLEVPLVDFLLINPLVL